MSEQDRREEAPAPGHWRVTAQPISKAAASAVSATPAGSGAGPVSSAAPGRTGGRPLLATLIGVGILALSLAGQDGTPTGSGDSAVSVGFVLGGALFGAILWAVAYAITIRKASNGWKIGSLIVLAVLGGLVALNKVATAGGAAPAAPAPVVRQGK